MLPCPLKESDVKLTQAALFCLAPGQRWQAANWVKNKFQNGKPGKERGHSVFWCFITPCAWIFSVGQGDPLPHTLQHSNSVITAVRIKYVSMTI